VARAAYATCIVWLAIALFTAAAGAFHGARRGALGLAFARLKSPTVYLFSAYLLVAAFVTPMAPGESTSPLLWLGLVLPAAYALATFASIGPTRRSISTALLLAVVYAGAVLAAAAIILALASPAFVPSWLR
jgi:hypothetical protein